MPIAQVTNGNVNAFAAFFVLFVVGGLLTAIVPTLRSNAESRRYKPPTFVEQMRNGELKETAKRDSSENRNSRKVSPSNHSYYSAGSGPSSDVQDEINKSVRDLQRMGLGEADAEGLVDKMLDSPPEVLEAFDKFLYYKERGYSDREAMKKAEDYLKSIGRN